MNIDQLKDKQLIIWTDSDYTCKCSKEHIHMWRKNNWLKSDNKPVKYKDVIEQIASYLEKYKGCVSLRHISEVGIISHVTKRDDAVRKGHDTLRVWVGNNTVDALAKGK